MPTSPEPEQDRQTELSYIAFEPEEERGDDIKDATNFDTQNRQLTLADSRAFRPPQLTFSPINRIHTEMAPNEANALLQRIIDRFYIVLGPGSSHHLDVIIWKRSADFFTWYIVEEGIEVSVLRFAIFNAHTNFEKAFYITRGDEESFLALKQYIWDFFWVSSNTNPGDFKVQVMTNPLPDEAFRYSLTGTSLMTLNSSIQDLGGEQIVPVVVRLQMDDTRRLSQPYDYFVLGTKYTVSKFFR
ncbi:hypothetical protein WAI453_013571 [Rhynchosporium graminicola]